MGSLIVCTIVSLDGCHTGPGGDVMAMPFGSGFSEYNAERLRAAGTVLLGRVSFEGFRDHWPPVADDPDAPPVEREISRRYRTVDKVVVSDSLDDADLGAWPDTTIVRRAEAAAYVRDLKERGSGDILVFGSHVLWNSLLELDLVDELHLIVGPGVVGTGGVPAFEAPATRRFELDAARRLPDSDLVLLRYRVPAAS